MLKTYEGMAIWPFGIYIRRDDYPRIKRLINHELIHWHQQRELIGIIFLIIYYIELLMLKLFKHGGFKHFFDLSYWLKAYRDVSFELEAYENQSNLDYLKTRKTWTWVKYLFKGFNKN